MGCRRRGLKLVDLWLSLLLLLLKLLSLEVVELLLAKFGELSFPLLICAGSPHSSRTLLLPLMRSDGADESRLRWRRFRWN